MSNIIEHIRALHLDLIQRPEYRRYVVATSDEASRTGSLDLDTIRAVEILHEEAQARGDGLVAGQKLAVIFDILERVIDRHLHVDLVKRAEDEADSIAARRALHGLPPETEEDRKRSLS